jgi:hypothetical protein
MWDPIRRGARALVVSFHFRCSLGVGVEISASIGAACCGHGRHSGSHGTFQLMGKLKKKTPDQIACAP